MALKGEKKKEWSKQYKEKNRDKINAYRREWRKTPYGRASQLLDAYKQKDKTYNRGEVDFDAQWIVDNIFSKPCVHCGETDWTKIGCNRIDNTKGHTKDNVEPCCMRCNNELNYKERRKDASKVCN